jgi:hypothetical protein
MDLKDLQGNNINTFISNYRKALGAQYDAQMAALNQQRTNDYAGIMGGANKAGMLYSNFPTRSKVQYDTQTFYPSAIKARQSYQTSLDKLRSNAIDLYNQNKTIQEAIDDLNKA